MKTSAVISCNRQAKIPALLFLALLMSACGKVGAPIPPARLSERTSELTAVQRGSTILISFPTPQLVQSQSSSSYIARVDIYRLVERRDQVPFLEAEDYEDEAEIIGFLDRATIEALAKSIGRMEYKDSLNLGQISADTRLRYAVRYVNKRGQQAAFSNTVAVEPVFAIARPPTNLRAATPTQGELVIDWDASQANTDGSAPAAVVGYNLYRARGARRLDRSQPLNEEPLTGTRFTDRTFQYASEYTYVVRAISPGNNGLLESLDSETITVTPVDTFPPSTPEPVSAASANGIISLFWPSSPQPDVAGYFIYRAEAVDAAAKDWVKLNAQPSAPVTFRDDRVVLEKRYFYRVTAVDKFGNESAPSNVVSEVANP